jgi:hypothetical protein
MSGVRLDGTGAGGGQPSRLDFAGREHLERLAGSSGLAVPAGGLPSARPETEGARGQPWAAQDALLEQQAELRQLRRERWEQFSGGQRARSEGSARGAVSIDAGLQARPGALGRIDPGDWATAAARFEEWARANGRVIGAETELKLPGGPAEAAPRDAAEPSSPALRRPFRVG